MTEELAPFTVAVRHEFFHKEMREARRRLGITQLELAALVGFNNNKIRAIESLQRPPTEDEANEISAALEIPREKLFPEWSRPAYGRVENVMTFHEIRPGELGGWSPSLLHDPEARSDFRDLREGLSAALATLKPREVQVLTLRFGLDGGGRRDLAEVGRALLVTRERIRQIEDVALRKLRHPSRTKHLRGLDGVPLSKGEIAPCFRQPHEWNIVKSAKDKGPWRLHRCQNCGLEEIRLPEPAAVSAS